MRAAIIRTLGETPVIETVPDPEPGPGELRIRIHACGLNFADTLMLRGRYQEKPELPFAPGLEIAGEVEALGPGTDGPAPGTRVAALTGHGGLADRVCVPAAACVALPDSMPMTEAAGFLVAYGTSQLALGRRARLAAGERLLVLGAAGGVGLTAVEIGKLMGAEVIACARGPERLELARQKGADHLIDSEAGDLRARVKALGGADVVYDPVGGPLFTEALRATRPEGRILPIGFASGEVPQIPANILLVKNLDIIGVYWGGYTRFRPEALAESVAQLLVWYVDGRLSPHVSNVLPLEEIAEGLALLTERRATGKVVIRMS